MIEEQNITPAPLPSSYSSFFWPAAVIELWGGNKWAVLPTTTSNKSNKHQHKNNASDDDSPSDDDANDGSRHESRNS